MIELDTCLLLIVIVLLIILSILLTSMFWRKAIRKYKTMLVAKKQIMESGVDLFINVEKKKSNIAELKEQVAKENAARSTRNSLDLIITVLCEVQSQLEGIAYFLKLLLSDSVPGRKEWTLLRDSMNTKSEQLSALVDGTMEVVALEKRDNIEKNDVVNVNYVCQDVFDECMEKLAEGVDTSFETSLDDDFTICTNIKALRKVLNYLILCSMEFTTTGSIKLIVSELERKKQLVFKVNDTGTGIPAEMKEYLFETLPKDNIKHKIIGIRLRVCRALVKLMGGCIYLNPHYEGGTSIVFTIKTK